MMIVTRCAIKTKNFSEDFFKLEDEASLSDVVKALKDDEKLILEVMGIESEEELKGFSFDDIEKVFFNSFENMELFMSENRGDS